MRKKANDRNIFNDITTIYIYLMMTVFLFWCGNSGYEQIATAKFKAFLTICGGYIAVMIVVAFESLLVGNTKIVSPIKLVQSSNWLQRLVVLYIIITWISAFVSPYYPETIMGMSRDEGALTITIYSLCFLLVSVYGKPTKNMLWVLAVDVLIFSALCIVQLYGYNPFGLFPEGYNYFGANVDYGGAYLGTIGNVDMVAAFLCLVIPILWIAVLRCDDKHKYLLLLPMTAALFVLLKMNVLSGLIGVFCGALLSLPVVLPVSGKTKKILWLIVGVCIIAGILLLIFVDIGNGMFHEMHELLNGRVNVNFGSGRIYIWKNVLERIPQRFCFGYGPDSMKNAGIEPFVRYDEKLDVKIVALIDVAHNEYLNILYHQGIFAFATYVLFLVGSARKWIINSSQNKDVAILGGAALCYCVQAFFGISYCATTIFFWIILGMLNNLSSREENTKC